MLEKKSLIYLLMYKTSINLIILPSMTFKVMDYVLRNMRPYIVSNHGIFLAWSDNKQRRYQGKMEKH